MAINWTPARYPLYGGVDTKIDDVVLQAPKLHVAENVQSDKTGSLQRRPGRIGLTQSTLTGSTVTDWVALGKWKGNLLGFGASRVYEYGETEARWNDRGRATSWRLKSRPVAADDSNSVVGACMDSAYLNGYCCYVYDTYNVSGANTVTTTRLTITDSNGTQLVSGLALQTLTAGAASTSQCKVVAFGTRFYIVQVDLTLATSLRTNVVDVASPATIVSTAVAGFTGTISNAYGGFFDMSVDLTYGPFLVHRTTTANQIRYGHVTTAGALTDAATAATAANASSIGCDVFGSSFSAIAYTTAVPNVYAIHLHWTGAAWVVDSTSPLLDAGLTLATTSVACKMDSLTTLRLWYSDTLTSYTCLVQSTYTNTGTIAARVNVLPRSILAAKPFTPVSGDTQTWVISEPATTGTQPTLYCMGLTNVVSAWANQSVAVYPLFGAVYGLSHVTANADGDFCFPAPHFVSITLNASGVPTTGSVGAISEVALLPTHSQSHVSVEDGQCNYLPGGFLQQYDGVSATETGFLSIVDTANRVSLTPSNGAGSLTSSTTYAYRIIQEWTNAQGEREFGTDNGPKVVTMAVGDDTVTIVIDCVPWTAKKSPRQNIVFGIYRTLAGPTSDSPHYRVGFIENNPAADRVTFTDLISDSTASTQATLNLDSGELDPIAPPSGHILTAGNGRVFIAGFADDPCLVMCSKQRGHGQALSFSDALTIQVPQSTGDITGLQVMNEALYVFTERSIYRVRGEGPNNLGVGSFSEPEVVTTETGAKGPRSVVLMPEGVMFERTGGGVSIVYEGGQVDRIGMPVEGMTISYLNSSLPGDYTGAVVVPLAEQVRFSTSTNTHVYDYGLKQWYNWTDSSDGPTVEWNGVHAGIRSQAVTYENDATWTDNATPYSATIQLGWYHPGVMQGNMSVRWFGIVGEAFAASYLRCLVAFDYDNDTQTVVETRASGDILVQYPVTKQKCTAIRITIRDALTDQYGADVVQNTAGWKLNEVQFAVGFRRGALKRVGVTGTVT